MSAGFRGRRIALLGAECTGKSELSRALTQAFNQGSPLHGRPATCIDEYLRNWCMDHGRTPLQHEQKGIAEEQQRRIELAAGSHDWVVCDTTALMTAVYSSHYFNDDSLLPWATARQRDCALTLLLATDLPWKADGLLRDGEAVRSAVDMRLRQVLLDHALPFVEVRGLHAERMRQAWGACAALGDISMSGSGQPGASAGSNMQP